MGLFDLQRVEGEGRLQRVDGISEQQCHQAEAFLSLVSRSCLWIMLGKAFREEGRVWRTQRLLEPGHQVYLQSWCGSKSGVLGQGSPTEEPMAVRASGAWPQHQLFLRTRN